MPPTITSLREAKSNLSRLVDRAANGEEFIIAKDSIPKARLVPMPQRQLPRRPRGWEGRVFIADDFDAPLPAAPADAFGDTTE